MANENIAFRTKTTGDYNESQNTSNGYRDWLVSAAQRNNDVIGTYKIDFEQRAGQLLTSSNTSILNKTVNKHRIKTCFRTLSSPVKSHFKDS
jgi:hypothetical protein